MIKKSKKKKKIVIKTLHQLLRSRPAEDISKGDIKALLAQHIIETPDFDPNFPITAQFNKHKLDALRLLFDIINSDDQLNSDDEWREMLAAGTPATPDPPEAVI